MTPTPAAGTPPPAPRLTSQVLFGLFVIALGVLFTLDNLGIANAADYLQYWPAILVGLGMVKIWNARRGRQGWVSGLILIGVGSYMLIKGLTYIQIDARMFWPMLLLGLGAYLVWRGVGRGRIGVAEDGSARFSAIAVMGSVSRRTNAQNFAGADLTAVLGGCDIDLRQASIAPGPDAVIDILAFWGGIDLKVPEDWTVITRAIPLMGGVEDKTRAPQGTAVKRLVIRGLVVMGGITVKN